jgi:hypothetical protein
MFPFLLRFLIFFDYYCRYTHWLAGNIVTHSLQVGVAQVLVLAAEPGDLPAQLNALHSVPSLPSLPLHPHIRPPGHAGTNYKENKVVARE